MRPRRSRTICRVLLATLLALSFRASAEDVLILRSKQAPAYLEAFEGAQAQLKGMSLLDLATPDPVDCRALKHKLQDAKVKVILSIGRTATQCALETGAAVPIVYCMVIDPADIGGSADVAGVHLQIPVSTQFRMLRDLLPASKKIAVLYDPVHSSDVIDRAREASQALGIDLLSLPVTSIKGVFPALRSLHEQGADVLWMVPDATIYNRDSVSGILRFTVENKIPFMASDKDFVRNGALCALSPRYTSVGAQAAAMVKAILAGTSVRDLPIEAPTDYGLYINAKTAALIGVTLNAEAAATATETFH